MKRFCLIAILIFIFLPFYTHSFAKSIEECGKECADKIGKKNDNQNCVCSCLHKSCVEECDLGPANTECKQKCDEGLNSCISDTGTGITEEQNAEEKDQIESESDLPEDTKRIIEQQVREKLKIEEPKDPLEIQSPENPVEVEF